MLPVQLGVIPFGLVCGVIAVDVGFSPFEASAMSLIVFAGASQLVVFQLLSIGAPLLVVILSAIMINLRFLMYGAGIAPYFAALSRRWKAVLSYILTDQMFAVFVLRFEKRPDEENAHWFFFGGAVSMWASWQIATIVGAIMGARVPESWSLDFAAPLTFMAIAMPGIKDRATVAAALVAGSIAVMAGGMPLELGLITAALSGVAAGVAVEGRGA